MAIKQSTWSATILSHQQSVSLYRTTWESHCLNQAKENCWRTMCSNIMKNVRLTLFGCEQTNISDYSVTAEMNWSVCILCFLSLKVIKGLDFVCTHYSDSSIVTQVSNHNPFVSHTGSISGQFSVLVTNCFTETQGFRSKPAKDTQHVNTITANLPVGILFLCFW